MRQLATLVAVAALIAYLTGDYAASVAQDNAQEQCESSQIRIQGSYDDTLASAADDRALRGQEDDAEKRRIYRDRADREETRANVLLAVAQQSGHQLFPGSPQINCADQFSDQVPGIF